jgi:hypothetical protein
VDQYFDETIYEKEQAKHSPEEIKRLVHQNVRFPDDDKEDGSS